MLEILSEKQLKEKAPSIYTSDRAENYTSKKYNVIKTPEIIEKFVSNNWFPVDAGQQKITCDKGRQGYQRHFVKLKYSDNFDNSELIPQIILVNSYDGRSLLKFMLGFYRLVCGNGLIVGQDVATDQLKHYGLTDDYIKQFVDNVFIDFNKYSFNVNEMENTFLDNEEKKVMATMALSKRFEEKQIDDKSIIDILTPRRTEDKGNSVWKTFNVIQENSIKGGVSLKSKSKRKITSRKIKNESTVNFMLNQYLWNLAEEIVYKKQNNKLISVN